VHFPSKFVAVPTAENEFPMDNDLTQKIETWKEAFMSMLIHYYCTRVAGKKIVEPDEVLECTRSYQRDNDHFADFIDKCLEQCVGARVSLGELFDEFKTWIRSENISLKALPKKGDVRKYMDKALGKPDLSGGPSNVSYIGYRIRSSIVDDNTNINLCNSA
jgi:phage/plasmid-associated DNA primase